jgi:hypothetical protein
MSLQLLFGWPKYPYTLFPHGEFIFELWVQVSSLRNTDYVLVPSDKLDRAVEVLKKAGWAFAD